MRMLTLHETVDVFAVVTFGDCPSRSSGHILYIISICARLVWMQWISRQGTSVFDVIVQALSELEVQVYVIDQYVDHIAFCNTPVYCTSRAEVPKH